MLEYILTLFGVFGCLDRLVEMPLFIDYNLLSYSIVIISKYTS